MAQSKKILMDQILMGDCSEILKTIPEKSIDLIFADPPYNLQLEKELWRPNSTRVNGVDEAWDRFDNFEAYDRFTLDWLTECKRILKDTGAIWVIGSYHNIFRVGKIMQDLGFWILNDIIWVKNNPMPNFHGVRFTNAHETLIWAQKNKGNKYTFNYHTMKSVNHNGNGNGGLQMRSDWKLSLCTGNERLRVNGEKAHPTQKPETLLERVILSSSNRGDIILDPFFGTGTTGAVAKRLGRHWVGIEYDPQYVALAQERIDSVKFDSECEKPEHIEENTKPKRIPFKHLINIGYIKVGEKLFYESDNEIFATVLPDGQLKYKNSTGSIHKIAREIKQAPCNGWLTWYYINLETGKYEPINHLRNIARQNFNKEGN